ncbi:MAG: hypothetical protein F6K50_02665 [Moorea sp. SIO3I7]|nr:hypothetical protein [Moorena sp. SIO3I7]
MNNKSTKHVQVIMESDLAEWVSSQAKREGMNRSSYIRNLLINLRNKIEGEKND